MTRGNACHCERSEAIQTHHFTKLLTLRNDEAVRFRDRSNDRAEM